MPHPAPSPGRTVPVRQVVAGIVSAVFFLGYPFVIYLAYTRLGARGLGVLLLALYGLSMLLRVRGSRAEIGRVGRQHAPLALLIGLAIATGNRTVLLLLPLLVSLYLLWTFVASLRSGPPMIERFARIVEDDLPDFTLPYCRGVTVVWCVFMAANSVCIAALAFAAPLSWWALYTGFVFYLLMGSLLAGEFVVRKLWFRYYQGGLADRLFARAFPAERTANGRRSLAYQALRLERMARGPNRPAAGPPGVQARHGERAARRSRA
jgi:uncharacterized membrane protein